MKSRALILTNLLLMLSLTLVTSCRTKDDTLAKIVVLDANNNPVSNAEVRAYASGTSGTLIIDDLVQSNSNGEAHFNYNDEYQLGQAGVAVLDVKVTKDSSVGHGVIKVVQEETVVEIIYLNI